MEWLRWRGKRELLTVRWWSVVTVDCGSCCHCCSWTWIIWIYRVSGCFVHWMEKYVHFIWNWSRFHPWSVRVPTSYGSWRGRRRGSGCRRRALLRSVVVAAVTIVLAAMHVHDNRMWKWEVVEGLRSGNEFNDFSACFWLCLQTLPFLFTSNGWGWRWRRGKISCSCLVLQSCEWELMVKMRWDFFLHLSPSLLLSSFTLYFTHDSTSSNSASNIMRQLKLASFSLVREELVSQIHASRIASIFKGVPLSSRLSLSFSSSSKTTWKERIAGKLWEGRKKDVLMETSERWESLYNCDHQEPASSI